MKRSAILDIQIHAIYCEQCDKRLEGELSPPALLAFKQAHRLHQEMVRFEAEILGPHQFRAQKVELKFFARTSDDWQNEPAVQTPAVERSQL